MFEVRSRFNEMCVGCACALILLHGGCKTKGSERVGAGAAVVGGEQGAAAGGATATGGQLSGGATPLPAAGFLGASGNGRRSIADVAESTVASVVNISSEKVIHLRQRAQSSPFQDDPFFRHFFGRPFGGPRLPDERRQKSLGSGVIVGAEGIILTNNHVIDEADRIQVTLSDEREFVADMVGKDPKSDLAVLRLRAEKKDMKGLTVAKFGDSSRLRLGDVVLAIGNPFGVGQTVTMGIISAKGRADVGIVDYEDFIQTDAAINPGNSGGALIDTEGNLIGINTAILSKSGGYQGIGFAIPSRMAQPIMESLLKKGKVVRGWLGVAIQDIDQDLAEAMGLQSGKGVVIADVVDGGPADRAGLQRGDVVLRIDGRGVDTSGKLRNMISAAGPDHIVKLDILRRSVPQGVEARLGEMPSEAVDRAEIDPNQGVLSGLTLGTVNPAAREKFRLPKRVRAGVVVLEVDRRSPAARSGFRLGDVILELNRKAMKSVSDFKQAYERASGRLLLLVYRQGTTMFLVLSKHG